MHFLIIGVGSIGERHLRNFLRIEGVECSIAEVNADTRKKISGEDKVQSSFADYRETNPADFDGAVVCVPANLHVPIATELVKAGTHVLIEKPLAVLPDGIEDVIALHFGALLVEYRPPLFQPIDALHADDESAVAFLQRHRSP